MDSNFNSQSILVVDDTPTIVQHLKQQLAADDIRVHFADTPAAAHKLLQTARDSREQFAVLIVGAEVTAEAGAQTLTSLRQLRPQCPWISLIDCSIPADDLQALLSARLQDQPFTVIAADNEKMLLGQIKNRLSQARNQANITALEAQLQSIQQRFEHLLDTSTEAIAFVVSGCHLYANPSFLEMVGIDNLEELERHSLLELLCSESGTAPLKEQLKQVESNGTESLELEALLNVAGDSTPLPVIARLQRASYGGENCIQVSITEKPVTVSVSSEQQLPGFLPKQAFYDLSTQAIDNPGDNDHAHAILCVRLDKFNEIQEQIGLVNSDKLTSERAALLHGCIDEEQDLLTHYSENLYLVKVSRGQRTAVEQLCAHIVEAFATSLAILGEQSLPVTCSVGYTMAGRQNNDINTLILEAARASREAEKAGGNNSLRYRPSLRSVEDNDNRTQWQERLRHALDNNELMLACHRISDIGDDSRALVSIDLCLHDNDSDTVIHSNAWSKAIQGSGLRAELDRQMIRLSMQKPDLLRKTLFIPICASEHDGKALADWLQASLKHINYQGDGLVFMLDSTDLVNNMQPAVMLQRAFSNLSVHWGLDLFGATDNAQQLLQHLQTSYVRLCASVLPKEHGNASEADQLSQLAAAGNNADAEIIACSVDNAAIVPMLWQSGIKLIQGEFIQQYPEVLEA